MHPAILALPMRANRVHQLQLAVRALALVLCLASSLGFRPCRADASPGDLDTSFGTGGQVTTDFTSGSDPAYALAIQTDGKIVVAGATGFGDFALSRYNPDGGLDTSFDGDGQVTTDIGHFDEAFALVIQQNGQIVLAGSTAPEGSCCQFALSRYNHDGTLDSTFDGDGKLTTHFGGVTEAFAVAIQADRKIVAAGQTYSPIQSGCALARYNPDGSLDTTFGIGGKVVTTQIGSASGLAVQPDGKIVVVGAGFSVVRYNLDGTLDTSFGHAGMVRAEFGGYDSAEGVAIQTDHKIVVAGTGAEKFALARFNWDGSPDSSFDGDGKLTTVFFGENIESSRGVAIQANGKIVATGSVFHNYDSAFATACYNSDGSLDATFGGDGKVTTNFGYERSEDVGQDVAVQADGNIVVVGGGGPCIPPCYFVLARYLGTSETQLQATLELEPNVINLKSHSPWIAAYIEPSGFDAATIDIASLRLAGSTPALTKFGRIGDHDGDGVRDLMVKFSRTALDPVLLPTVTSLEITGSLVTGERFAGIGEIRVMDPSGKRRTPFVSPNPFNPYGTLTFSTMKPGRVRVAMFDLQGRLVRTLLEAPLLPAGEHKVWVDGKGSLGEALPSGMYFYHVSSPDGDATGRLGILK